jgi:hypothetical protein
MRAMTTALGRMFVAGLLALLSMGCAPGLAPRCSQRMLPLSAYFYDTSAGAAWFTDAIVHVDYHDTVIAPAEVATSDEVFGFAVRVAIPQTGTCMSWGRLAAKLETAPYVRISGRGELVTIDGRQYFRLDCVCSVEAFDADERLRRKMWAL